MHFGIFVEEMRQGVSQTRAFQDIFELADRAEAWGVDCVWLGEIHFTPVRSVISASLQVAGSIASRNRRLRVGTAVQVLPLNHPLRIAEEVAWARRCVTAAGAASRAAMQGMHKSERRILVTHVGSIPRPPVLRDLLVRQDRGEPVDQRDLDRLAEQAVRDVVEQQLEVGVDVGNDGEQPRAGFSTYVARRMEGFGGESRRRLARDIAEHPDYRAMLDFRRRNSARVANAPQAVAEVRYTDLAEAERECDLFTRCADGAPRQFTERFMTAVSPGTAATILLNAHYDSHEQYIMALGRELRKEYELIHRRGFILQLDCPDLAMERDRFFQDNSLDQFLKMVELHVDAINQAIAGIPASRIRLHVCWGNYDGPHTHDVPMEAILPLLYRAKVGRSPCRSPIRGTSTSTQSSSTSRRPPACCSCPA